MVMGRRPGVQTASKPIAAIDAIGLAGTFAAALARVPLRAPWRGPLGAVRNMAVATTRESVRSFIGYLTSLPIDEFRALERVLDDVSRTVLPPFVTAQGVSLREDEIAGVPGLWFRVRGSEPVGTLIYLHGGGYIGTSPSMYALFMAHLARKTGCDVFVADYRLAPEFPYPAATDDVTAVLQALSISGAPGGRIFLGGDSGGGGLAGSVLHACRRDGLPFPKGVVLFSPEVTLELYRPSVTENAALDVLPWNVPTNPYLHGVDPHDEGVSLLSQDLSGWPPTFVAYGEAEIFRDGIRDFVARLGEAGVEVHADEALGMFHVFPFLLPWARESQQVYAEVGEFIRRLAVPAPEETPADQPLRR